MASEHLRNATWFFFDLDDTLHEFREASSTAVDETLQVIIQFQHHAKQNTNPQDLLTVPNLKAEYAKVLKSGTSAAFVDGKTSHEYRAERFKGVMDVFDLEYTESQVKSLLNVYESTLKANFRLKSGVISLLRILKSQGKKIAIVTEGPQDAQERTVAALGLLPHVDSLITTNKLGVAKIHGLFGKALEMLQVQGKDAVMVGDSWERDIIPAIAVGMHCVWFAEKENEGLLQKEGVAWGGVVAVNSLKELERLVQ
jgi:putative hydrolase of the HAD superfamily